MALVSNGWAAFVCTLLFGLGVSLRFHRLLSQGNRYYDEGLYQARALFQFHLLAYVGRHLRGLVTGREDLKDTFSKITEGWYARNANYQLHEWAIALAMKMFGQREWAGRVVSAFFGVLIMLLLPVVAFRLGGPVSFWVALGLVATDAVAVYYSRTGFGDTMASFFLLLAIFFLHQGSLLAAAPVLVFLAGVSASLCLMSKTQYYFLVLGLETWFAALFLTQGELLPVLLLFVFFNLGLGLPILVIELYYRVLKHWGYEFPTYLQLVHHQYFTITKSGDRVEEQTDYRQKIPWFRWRWLQFFLLIENPLVFLLFLLTAVQILRAPTTLGLWFLLLAAIPVCNWLRNQFCALRYLFANSVVLLLAASLFLPKILPLSEPAVLWTLLLVHGIAGASWSWKYTRPSSRKKLYETARAMGVRKIFSADFYNAQIFFPRQAVRYSPSSLAELRRLYAEGFTHMLVDVHSTFALRDDQEEIVAMVEKNLKPVVELDDEAVREQHFWWEYCYSKIVTPKYERCFRESPEKYSTLRLYDLGPLAAGNSP